MTEQDPGLHVSHTEVDGPDRAVESGRLRLPSGRRLARIAAIMLGAATGLAIAVFLLMDSPLLQSLIWGSTEPGPSAHSLLPGRGPTADPEPRDADLVPGSGGRATGPETGSDIVSGRLPGPEHDSGPVPLPWQASGSTGSRRPVDGCCEVTVPARQAGLRAHDRDRLPASPRRRDQPGDAGDDASGQSAGRPRDLLPADLRAGNTGSAVPDADRDRTGPGVARPRGGSAQTSGTAARAGGLRHPAAVPGPVSGTVPVAATRGGPAAGTAVVTGSPDLPATRGASLLADLEAMQVRAFRLRLLLEENTLRARICETSKPAFRPVWCVEAPPAPAIAPAQAQAQVPRRNAVPPAPELLGVAGSRSGLAALLRLAGRTLRVREGERAGAWKVNRIETDGAVTVSHPSGRRIDLQVGG